MKFLVIDVESIGLHGEGFAVGAVTLDSGSGQITAVCEYWCPPCCCEGTALNRTWVEENVTRSPWHISEGFPSSASMRAAFWDLFLFYKKTGHVLAADCPWPVEANFLSRCLVEAGSGDFSGPYPFVDIASVLLAAGRDPLGSRERMLNELPAHNALNDARQSARLLHEALRSIPLKEPVHG